MEATSPFSATTSVLSLAAAMRRLDCIAYREPLQELMRHDPPVPMYIVEGDEAEDEAASALQTMEEVSDRLSRLRSAYGEWSHFDAGAYFDLSPAQAQRLVRISERVSTVHVTFYVDLLLPSFRTAEIYWHDHYCPAYRRMKQSLRTSASPADSVQRYSEDVRPEMLAKWNRLVSVVKLTRQRLFESGNFLVAYLCEEEALRWLPAWRRKAVRGVDPQLQPEFQTLSTLTMSTEFPLPAARQPGRLRRLRANRDRGRPSRFLHWRSLDG